MSSNVEAKVSSSQRRIRIAIGLAVAAAAAFFGIHYWRARGRQRRNIERVLAYGKALSDYEACLTGGAPGDFATAVVFAHPGGFRYDDESVASCKQQLDQTFASFGATARALGILAEPFTFSATTISRDDITAPSLGGPGLVETLHDLCRWDFEAHRDLELMFKAIDRPPPAEVECWTRVAEHYRPKLLPTLGEYISLYRKDAPEVVIREPATSLRDIVAFLPSADISKYQPLIAKSFDGKDWSGVVVPGDVVIAASLEAGFVGVARGSTPTAPWELRANDGHDDYWSVVGKLPARADALLLHADAERITLVATRPATADVVEAVTSTDGGKRFGSPRVLVDRRSAAATDLRAMADGTIVALSLPRSAPNEVDVARLAPGAAQPDVSKLSLAAPIGKPEIAACHGRTSEYAVVGGRFLVGSADSGATWAQIADLGASASPAGLYCTAEQVIVTRARRDGIELTACTGKACQPPARVAGDAELLFARSQPDHVEVWLASTAEMRKRYSDGYVVRVYALASGALTPKRMHVMPPRDPDHVAARFVDLGGAFGWIDPHSGAGDMPWLSTPVE